MLHVEEMHLKGDIIPNITNCKTFCTRCPALQWTAPPQWPAPPAPTWWTPAAPSSSQVSVIPQPSNLCPPWMRESARGGAGQRRIASSTHPCPTLAFSTPLALLRETLARDAGQDPRGHRWTNFLQTVVTVSQLQQQQQPKVKPCKRAINK